MLTDWRAHLAQALAALVPTEPEHFATDVLRRLLPLAFSKELVARHGATLGIAEITNALCEVRTPRPNTAVGVGAARTGLLSPLDAHNLFAAQAKHTIPDDVQTALRNLVPKVEKARLYVHPSA